MADELAPDHRADPPASRWVVVWAVLLSAACGLFAAAGATRLAWQTAPLPPDRTEATALLHEALPGSAFSDLRIDPARFVIYGQPFSLASADSLLFGDGGEYQQGSTAGAVTGPAVDLADVARRLRARGWTVYDPVRSNAYDCVGPPCDPAAIPTVATLIADHGNVVATLTLSPSVITPAVSFGVARSTPAAVYPAGLAGGVVGAGLAWIVFGWARRRISPGSGIRAIGATLVTFALLLWWPPVLLGTLGLVQHQLREPHPSWHPLWEWLGQPTFSLFFLAGTGCLLLATALAAVARRPTPDPQWTDAAAAPQ